MKRFATVCVFLIFPFTVFSQSEPSGNTLAATMDVFVFPAEGQEASQQSKDEAECYNWATSNTGSDPFQLVKQQEAVEESADAEVAAAEEAGKGAGAKGAVRGAAAGAIIGEVTGGDAGESAAIGAAAVAVRGRRQAKRNEAEAEASADAQVAASAQHTEAEIEDFKKAFSVCLEAKKYMVKY
jgi:hypothetical protein